MTETVTDENDLLQSQNDPDNDRGGEDLMSKISSWSQLLKDNALLADEPSPTRQEPFKNIYKALETVTGVHEQILSIPDVEDVFVNFRLKFLYVHTSSSLAKWHEQCEDFGESEKYHRICLTSIQNILQNFEELNIDSDEIKVGVQRCHFMYIYENTRFAIVCSERDKQNLALEHLVKAEELYHKFKNSHSTVSIEKFPTLAVLDSLNSKTLQDMFTYVLFYLGQAYKISGSKEKALLYLHTVLRQELEKQDTFSPISWASDASKMANVIVSNIESFEAACNVLLAATAVMNKCSEEEKNTDNFKQNYAELGRCWVKVGNELLAASCDRLKDLQEARKHPKYQKKIILTSSEIQSLGIDYQDENEYDTLLLIKSLNFPTLDLTEVREKEMRGKYVRDFQEARSAFLPLQRWINVSKAYYCLEEYASDYIDIMTDYANAFKHISFFEPSLVRQAKMHKRRILILEDLLENLSPTVYYDIYHFCLRDIAEINETVYKLKVAECKERGLSLKPKDKKLVGWLEKAVGAHKRNLTNFKFDIKDPVKDFESEYEKLLLGSVLTIGRILGAISHDHPLHPLACDFAMEAKKYYEFFLRYLDHHQDLKTKDFQILYEGTLEMPDLMEKQIRKISAHHRTHSVT